MHIIWLNQLNTFTFFNILSSDQMYCPSLTTGLVALQHASQTPLVATAMPLTHPLPTRTTMDQPTIVWTLSRPAPAAGQHLVGYPGCTGGKLTKRSVTPTHP